jgi:hypothetical protein
MGAAELMRRTGTSTVVCVGNAVEVLTVLDQTAASVRGPA